MAYIAPLPSAPVVLSREALEVLSLVDLTASAHRLLHLFLARFDPDFGTVNLSQRDMGELLALSHPSVNKAVGALERTKLAWPIDDALYQLHPVFTGGKMSDRLAVVPEIVVSDPESLREARRQRYSRQTESLPA
ncbi:helix-turn-helix domain-containing protein [Kitasatospora sp. NPDC017646]|uniref:helix-turn-helix domain-containing protein n=1 Tax=Kitasatospora sp. NPDC017646 TaxID=3364024 RepID=UPI0037BB202B